MAEYEYVTVNVFTDRRFGGNPLAVVPDARGLSDAQMQALAAEFNLSETAFVLPPDNPQHHARVRIFGPRAEMPFAGHPNVGTGFVLALRDEKPPEHYVFEEKAGLVRVHVLRDRQGVVTGARISAPQPLSLGIGLPEEVVAACADLVPEEIVTTSHGPIVAEVASVEALSRASPDLAEFRNTVAAFRELDGRLMLHLYAQIDGDATRLRARMFAPLTGVLEDPATGSANAALAALLTSLAPGENVDLTYDIHQGVEMGRPSQIVAAARKTAEGPVTATVSGSCVSVMRGVIEV